MHQYNAAAGDHLNNTEQFIRYLMHALYRLRCVAAIVRLLCGAQAGASAFTSVATAAYAEYWEDAAKLNVAHSPLISVKDAHDI